MPTDKYLEEVQAQFEFLDDLPLWQAELVWEYGVMRAMAAIRYGYSPAKTRIVLEAERQQMERDRWGLHSR